MQASILFPRILFDLPYFLQYARFVKLDVTTPLVVDIALYDLQLRDIEHLHKLRLSGDLSKKQLASKRLNRLYMKPGTKRILLTLKEHGIHGTLFIPPGDGPFPGNCYRLTPDLDVSSIAPITVEQPRCCQKILYRFFLRLLVFATQAFIEFKVMF